MIHKLNLIGAITAQVIYVAIILIFAARLMNKSRLEYILGWVFMLTAVPLIYLLITAPTHDRPALYYVQIVLMLMFIAAELLLDYVLKIPFREIQWMTVSYVTLFFAATGGMIGAASHAGRGWTVSSVILFLIMAALAFLQRAVTGR